MILLISFNLICIINCQKMNQQSKNIVYEHKLEVMQDQNNELMRQIAILKQSNEALLVGLTDIESLRQENYTLALQNRQLTDMLQSQKKRCEQLEARRYSQTKSLKQQLNERINYIERMRIQHQKQLFRQSQELRQVKVKQKRNENFDQMTRSMAISSCLYELKPSFENSMERSNNISYSNIQRPSSKSPIQSRLTYMPKNSEEYRFTKKDKENNYNNYSKEELKVALKALTKAGKVLREGDFQVSMIQQRKSCIKRQ